MILNLCDLHNLLVLLFHNGCYTHWRRKDLSHVHAALKKVQNRSKHTERASTFICFTEAQTYTEFKNKMKGFLLSFSSDHHRLNV